MEQRWGGVDQNAEQQDQNAEQRRSKCGAKGIKVWSKVDQNADQNAEQGGAKDIVFI